jgi:acetylornithine/succinyldiaminopimelate/putrescine aminotransferase
MEHETSDAILFVEDIASGLPLGRTVSNSSIMDQRSKGTNDSTFGGNPVVCTAALVTHNTVESL